MPMTSVMMSGGIENVDESNANHCMYVD